MAGAQHAGRASGPAWIGGFEGNGRRLIETYRVEAAMLGALLLLCAVLSIFAENFLTEGNIRNVLWQVTAVGIIAIGQTFVILTAGIDLSVGGIAAVAAINAMNEGCIPPTLNLTDPAPEVGDLDCTPLQSRTRDVRASLVNAFGFGGQNSALIFRRWDDGA